MRAALVLVVWLISAAGLAQIQQEGRLPPSWPCVEGIPVDPSYPAISEATGGQTFLFHPSEVGESAVLAINLMRHEQTIFRAMADLNGAARDFSFPVDSTVRSLLVVASVQCLDRVSLVRPDGTLALPGEPGVEDHLFRAGRIIKIDGPVPGAWVLRIAGRGLMLTGVYAQSTLDLSRARFAQPPAVGVTQLLEASLWGPIASARFRLVSLDGSTLESLDLEKVQDSETYRGAVTVREPLFRVAVDGVDTNGFPFQRLFPFLFQAAASSQ